MKRNLNFLRTTLVGGVLFLAPIIVLGGILGKALAIARQFVDPLAEHIPVHSVLGLHTPVFLAIGLIVFICFLAGFFARTVLAKKIVHKLETVLLSNIPGYEFFKATSASALGVQPQHEYEVIFARIEDAWQLAFLVERLAGGQVAVFVPSAPNPYSGAVYFMTQDRIKPSDIPMAEVLKCLKRIGAGSNALLHGLPIQTASAK